MATASWTIQHPACNSRSFLGLFLLILGILTKATISFPTSSSRNCLDTNQVNQVKPEDCDSDPPDSSKVQTSIEYEVYFEWKTVEFEFPSKEIQENLMKENKLILKNVIITAPKIFQNRMFLTTPRFLEGGVPVTFSVVPYDRNYFDIVFGWRVSPKLKPFPSYEMQEEGNCTAFQLVEGMEIDQFGRLWVVDVGRTNILTPAPKNNCPAKLVVFDLKDKDKLLFSYSFPADVVSRTGNALKDITVACTTKDDCWAYISDFFGSQLVIYDAKNRESWAAVHPSMAPDPAKENFTIGDTKVFGSFGIAGQGLAPKNGRDFSTLYYTAIASDHLYMVQTATLKNPNLKMNKTLEDSDVVDLGMKNGQSDGMAMDNYGILYYGNLVQSSVYQTPLSNSTTKIGLSTRRAQSEKELSWPDTFGFDGQGYLALTTTKFQKFAVGTLNPNEINYRVVRFFTGSKAYSADY